MRWPPLRRSGTDTVARMRVPTGQVADRLDQDALTGRLASAGDAGGRAGALDRDVEESLAGASFSPLSSQLAETYLDRIGRPLTHLTLESGAYVTARGYVAHRLVESDPGRYGAAEVPVLGTLPTGRPPADLLNRVVRATRRGFEHVCALDAATWQGYLDATTWRAHRRDDEVCSPEGEAGYLDPRVIDGLLRFGWVLRQVDLHYGAS